MFEYLSKNKNTDYRMCVAWLLAVEPVIVKHNAWATVAVLRSTRWANGMRGARRSSSNIINMCGPARYGQTGGKVSLLDRYKYIEYV